MTVSVEVRVEDGCAMVTVTGSYEPDSAVDEFEKLLAFCKAQGLQKALVDYTGLEGRGYATQEILYAASAAEAYHAHLEGGGLPVRLAYVGTEAFIGTWIPSLEVARAEGVPATATTDMDEARRWLELP